jgi:hypothetical protein
MTEELFKSPALARIEEEAEKTIPDILAESMAVALVAQVPLVGEAIKEMVTQLSFRRTHERMRNMFDEMTDQVNQLGEDKIDREWFKSEEFQTLLFEAMRQLHTTHDKQKIEMLGRALANSGALNLRDEGRKELFVQLVRELTPQHIRLLVMLQPRPTIVATMGGDFEASEEYRWRNRGTITPDGENLLLSQMLSANGLLHENLTTIEARPPSVRNHSSIGEIDRALKEFAKELQRPPVRTFCLSELGRDFLRFVGIEPKSLG